MIDIKSKCGEVFHADEKFVGKKIKCPHCGEVLTIQIPETPKTESSESYQPHPFTNSTRSQTTNHVPKRKWKTILKRVAPLLILLAILALIIVFSTKTENSENRPASGSIYTDHAKAPISLKDDNSTLNTSPYTPNTDKSLSVYTNSATHNFSSRPSTSKLIQKPVDPYLDWSKLNLRTGTSPGCFNFTPTYDDAINNKLEVKVGSNTDVVLKLISYTTGKCIRYVYIRSRSTYDITNIPQDTYYTKIAYGTDWRQKIINGQCVGKFVHNALYKKGEQILDFNVKYDEPTYEGDSQNTHYKIPWYSLSLDVVASDFDSNTYNTNSITEEEFNK